LTKLAKVNRKAGYAHVGRPWRYRLSSLTEYVMLNHSAAWHKYN